MCKMLTMPTSVPAFVEDIALASASPKLLFLPMVITGTTQVSVKPLSLPTVVEESAKVPDTVQMSRPSSEKYVPRADGVLFQFQSEAFRLRIQVKISELMLTAASTETCNSTNALLAKKTLKYRRVLERRPFASAVKC
ncbi:hypothetical protein DVH05_022899 [Phytophthora capsici]|nr:hypothetical protein DVH05_022899 [Phytophthora capsici]